MKCLFIFFMLSVSLNNFGQGEAAVTDWANLHKYAGQNKTVKAMAKGKRRVVFMGDSITEGWQSADSSFFADNAFINRGIGGQTTPQMLLRFRADVIDLQPEAVVILAGINDIAENTGPATTEQIFGNIVSMVELAQANKIQPVVCSVLPAFSLSWRPAIRPGEKIVALNALLLDYCKKNQLVYLDYFSKMVDGRNGLDKRYTYDEVHVTAEGYKVMEPLVKQAIKRALKKGK